MANDPIPMVPLMERSPMRVCVETVTHHPAGQCVPKRTENEEEVCPGVGYYLGSVPLLLMVRTAMPCLQIHSREDEVVALISGGVGSHWPYPDCLVPTRTSPPPGSHGGGIAVFAGIPAKWRRVPPTGVLCSKRTHPLVFNFKVGARRVKHSLITDCRVWDRKITLRHSNWTTSGGGYSVFKKRHVG